MTHSLHTFTRLAFATALCLLMTGVAVAQPTFSIDFQGPTNGVANSFTGAPITASDILTAGAGGPPGPNLPVLGPTIPPGTWRPGGPANVGLGIATYPFAELDALSYGTDPRIRQNRQMQVYFSVDEFAVGQPGIPAPSVTTEGAFGSFEASADVFNTNIAIGGGGNLCPNGPRLGNIGIIDGNGLPSLTPAVYPGTGLIEPNAPTVGVIPDNGDNLDALDMDSTQNANGLVYFSLDSRFADPLEPGTAANLGTAAANGFVGGDVLVSAPGGPPAIYAASAALGLGNLDVNDLDALVLAESGDGIYTPSLVPYDWNIAGSNTDMLLFSVRRGSAIIGAADAICGMPISEGDILTTTAAGPGIFIAAEVMGLATARSGFNTFQGFDDDLDALDMAPEPSSLVLLSLSCMGLLSIRRRRALA